MNLGINKDTVVDESMSVEEGKNFGKLRYLSSELTSANIQKGKELSRQKNTMEIEDVYQ